MREKFERGVQRLEKRARKNKEFAMRKLMMWSPQDYNLLVLVMSHLRKEKMRDALREIRKRGKKREEVLNKIR